MRPDFQHLVARELYREALSLYAQCHASSFRPTSFTFPFVLKACGKLRSALQVRQVHAHVLKAGFPSDVYSATALTDAYMKLGLVEDALETFDVTPNRNVSTFNALISGFCQNGCFEDSLWTFQSLRSAGFFPSSVTIASVLPACGSIEQGDLFHGLSVKLGFELDEFVATSIMTMYSNCGELSLARRMFELLPVKKVVAYNAMISGMSLNGTSSQAFDVFKQMVCSGEKPNSSTLVSLLSLCSELSILEFGKQIHSYHVKNKLCIDTKVETTMVDVYSKCGSWRYAFRVFTSIDQKDLITWNSMISGFLLHGRVDNALELFQQLEAEGLKPDETTWNLMISGYSRTGNADEALRFFNMMLATKESSNLSLKSITSVLQACSAISNIRNGKEVHGHAVRRGILHQDCFFFTALVDMYMKCGYCLHAQRIFHQFGRGSMDSALWNAMISGYGRNGDFASALEMFSLMQKEKIKPDSATFLGIISTCSHAGRVQEGYELFRMMIMDYGLDPKAEHFSCMVDLLGRSGKLKEAWKLLQEIPKPTISMYHSLLGAVMCSADAELGELMVEKLSKLDPNNPGAFVILSNIYAAKERWKDVEKLREMLVHQNLKKLPGFSKV